MSLLHGKVFIITGSARGLGMAFAEAVLKSGGKVTISDVLEDAGHETTNKFTEKFGKGKVHWCRCDVTSEDNWRELWESTEEHFGAPVDVLVNNAGIAPVPPHNWRRTMAVNILGVMTGVELAYEKMGKGGRGGHIINVASLAGFGRSFLKEYVSYFASKAGVVSLSKSLGSKAIVDKENIRVDCVCPCYADTAMVTEDPKALKESRSFGELIPVSQVVDAFMCLATKPGSGRALIVLPREAPHLYWPVQTDAHIHWMAAGALLAKKVMPGLREFTFPLQVLWTIISIFLAYLLLKIILAGICAALF